MNRLTSIIVSSFIGETFAFKNVAFSIDARVVEKLDFLFIRSYWRERKKIKKEKDGLLFRDNIS